ncbi:DUF927 domain-containing protein [Cedecea sp. NFIX57]|uniref:DUF927 domain-containing protein n=1 Tax=Cedecea sp. NFIX57 TaxID=1566286 RepID=UPI000A0C2061|nr:DUF927 domain-containing protein [Cedecea sp. NFIX57]SMG61811.1 putative DNA primase/helicase [Cedecea sp. NFIX57]
MKDKTIRDTDRLKDAASAPAEPMRPYYDVENGALVYVGVITDRRSGATSYGAPLRLCDALEVTGRGVDDSGIHFRVLHWKDSRNEAVTLAIPAADIGDRDGWRLLKGRGLSVSAQRHRLELLADYLMMHGSKKLWHITPSGGWCHGAYILPSGEIVGEPDRPMLYNGDRSHAASYRPSGTLADWQKHVATLAQGNSRAMFAIGCALAAPLMWLADLESGGFHLFGDSSSGKTGAAAIGASVWGEPDGQKLSWDSTPLALTNAAAARNDGLMWLDEIGQGKSFDIGLAAYRLFNGVGRMQGAREGGNRTMARFRTLVLSTGEKAVNTFMMADGQAIHAGQEVRLPDVPADAGAGLGAWEDLHHHASAGELAEAVSREAKRYHGTAGLAFLDIITRNREAITGAVNDTLQRWRHKLPPEASGQARRVTSRFGLVAAALELAGRHSVTGWKAGDGERAVEKCFSAWLMRTGTGKREDLRITEQAEDWFAINALGRFIRDDEHRRLVGVVVARETAGRHMKRDGADIYYVFRGVFNEEIAAGFDPAKAAQVLHDAGMLAKGSDGRIQRVAKMPGHNGAVRVYEFIRTTRTEDDEK